MNDHSALELEVDDVFQAREWLIQRLGWGIWAGVLAAASVGLLGPGLLSDVTQTSRDASLRVSYEKFVRYHKPTVLSIEVADVDPLSTVRLKLHQNLLDRVEVSSITPEPIRQELNADGVIYEFTRRQSQQSVKIAFFLDYHQWGKCHSTIELVGSQSTPIRQYVYP